MEYSIRIGGCTRILSFSQGWKMDVVGSYPPGPRRGAQVTLSAGKISYNLPSIKLCQYHINTILLIVYKFCLKRGCGVLNFIGSCIYIIKHKAILNISHVQEKLCDTFPIPYSRIILYSIKKTLVYIDKTFCRYLCAQWKCLPKAFSHD